MPHRDPGEPEYPATGEEVQAVCSRFVEALREHLAERLVCVLLSGSWARGEAKPSESDLDLTVVVDSVDEPALEALRQAWIASGAGPANIYGAGELPLLSRDGLEQFTTNAITLYGHNPFPAPTRADFARDLARVAESIARYTRSTRVYLWMSPELKVQELRRSLSKWDLRWALRCLAGYRTGEFPHDEKDLRRKLSGCPEEQLLEWCDTVADDELGRKADEIALQMNRFGRSWFREIAPALAEPSQSESHSTAGSPHGQRGMNEGKDSRILQP